MGDSISLENVSTIKVRGRTSVPQLSSSRDAVIYFDFTLGKLRVSQAGGAFGDLVGGGGLGSGDMVLADVQIVTGKKTFGAAGAVGKFALAGSTSGSTILNAAAVAGSGTVVLPTTGTLATLAGSETFTNKTLTAPVINSPTGIVKGDVGLGNVDNTSDATKDAATATLTNKTLTAPTIGSFANANHNHTNSAGGGTLAEAALALTDITTNNASASKHGFLPKLSGNAAEYLKGDGTWGAGGGSQTPWTANVDADGFNLLFDDATGIKSSEAGNPSLLLFTSVPSGVNGLGLTNSVTGTGLAATAVTIQPSGSDANISLSLLPKGTSNATQSRIVFGSFGGFTIWGDGDWQLGNNAGTSWSRLRFADAFALARGGPNQLSIQKADGSGTMAAIDSSGVLTTGDEGSTGGVKTAYVILSTTDNQATISATNLIPAGCILLAVTTRVRTALGTSHGLTSVSIGDGTTANLFGNNEAITSGATTNLTDHLSTFGPKLYTANTSVVFTANGGNFDGTGEFRVTIYYILITAPTS